MCRPRCPKCSTGMRFRTRTDDWRCPKCGRIEMDHGDHPGRDDYCEPQGEEDSDD